jgi:hypothetical protein
MFHGISDEFVPILLDGIEKNASGGANERGSKNYPKAAILFASMAGTDVLTAPTRFLPSAPIALGVRRFVECHCDYLRC